MLQFLMNQMIGKITFYSPNDGNGIILTEDKQKYTFEAIEWDDFDNAPSVGLLVSFVPEGSEATQIEVSSDADETFMPNQKVEKKPVSVDDWDFDDTFESQAQESEALVEELNVSSAAIESSIRPETIRLDKGVDATVREYFANVEEHIKERTGFQSSKLRLDFLRIRRFLFTTYNNLIEMDTNFITPEIKKIRDDLIEMSRVYDDYKVKTTYPDVAFDKIFLSQQSEYVQIKKESELVFREIQKQQLAEQVLSQEIEEREEVLKTVLRSSVQFERLMEEFKEAKKEYVDTVHMIATYNEQYHIDLELLREFENRYKEEFFSKFKEASKRYRRQILYILDAQAYEFDAQLWRQARKSKEVKRFFQKAHIKGEYCAKTYLKYYLNTLDTHKLSKEQSELFELYRYLETIEHKTAVVIVRDVSDALEIKSAFSKYPCDIDVQVFTDEKSALKWAKENSFNLLVVGGELSEMSAARFLVKMYNEFKIGVPIILVGHSPTAIHKQIPIAVSLKEPFNEGDFLAGLDTIYKKEKCSEQSLRDDTVTTAVK